MHRLALALVASLPACSSFATERTRDPGPWPTRVLITNDDGIEDEQRLLTMARAFERIGCEVVVAVPREDRSGSTHYLTLANPSPQISVERLGRHEAAEGGPTTAFYVVDGFPADCVLFALAGPLRERMPDLVVSGINGGSNVAEGWIGSGTIGATRMAAYLGVPGLAVSGLDEDAPGSAAPVAEWVTRLASSEIVRGQPAGGYVTVALPARPFAELRGVRVASRSPITRRPVLASGTDAAGKGKETWKVTGLVRSEPEPGSDADLHARGYVVITPMRANEDDADRMATISVGSIPALLPVSRHP